MSIPNDLELRLVESFSDLEDFFRWLSQDREVLGFDTETTGLSPERDHIRLVQFGDERMGWALSWKDWRGVAKQVFETYEGDLVAHNLKFDVRQICNDFGWSVTRWPWHRSHDTQGMAHIADSQRSKALKTLSDRLVDPRASQGQKALDEGMKKNGWTWATVPVDFPPYWQYGALDPVLAVLILKALKKQDIPSEVYDMEMGSTRVAAKMEEYGFLIDRAYCIDTSNKLDQYAQSVRQYLHDTWNISNPTPMQLVRFFEKEGVELIPKKTNSGNQAMDKHVLETTDHVVAQQVLALRKAEKMSGTYLHNFIDRIGSDHVLHANINTMAARTGRMSISDPSLQNLPRRDPLVRNAFLPREGHTLLTIDADQIEARLTAHFSEDQGLIDAFLSPEDFFCAVASQAFGKEVVKGMSERDLIKGVVYGKVYGASVMTMAASAGVPPEDMHQTNALFDSNYPNVHKFMERVIREGKGRRADAPDDRGFVTTPYGRKIKADRGREYTLVNYLIQCHASEILKKKIVELDAILPSEVKMVLPVHDEIIFDVPTEMVADVQHEAENVLNDYDNYKVPITWGGEVCPTSWGSKYEKKGS